MIFLEKTRQNWSFIVKIITIAYVWARLAALYFYDFWHNYITAKGFLQYRGVEFTAKIF